MSEKVSRELSPSITAVTSGQAHTPGPWVAQVDTVRKSVRAPGRAAQGPLFLIRVLRDSSFGPGDAGEAQVIANARLIAAAPELLEALQNLLAVYNGEGGTRYHAGDIASAAIAKATGLAPSSATPIPVTDPGIPQNQGAA